MEASRPISPAAMPSSPVDEKIEEHLWLIYGGQTYRVPMSFVRRHPKGKELILPYANQDMTEAYDNAGHSKGATRTLRKYADATRSAEEIEKIYATQRAMHEQAAWNMCVRVGSLLSVAAVLGAVYVRCRQQNS
ncbi:hypothetical protein ABB37_05992 [Leptomonas pyrrhocoris]|uniref:Cytochrome b5 heme-binding domain-containing protein n=1 Tax=Leptomonas pyrrhocoris TaxID=157538 RepID=A0A0N0VEP7_LEPPY|nr:hypothetical protein ABB37_05992 [Leptomonas pyrrhocoris]KPA78928.1 hypothetical protein ABB37_05992 [Leptomonas pyrrhocoris]|eukprot:XP_015657367.1 hypothetical protein ABB37_05992 [Leptomonas pyrrhocoris]